MRDALNASTTKTGRPIYYSITGIVPYNDAQPEMHCIKQAKNPGGWSAGFQGAFTVRPWVAEGRNPVRKPKLVTPHVPSPAWQTIVRVCSFPTGT
jgi:hypothetical protein